MIAQKEWNFHRQGGGNFAGENGSFLYNVYKEPGGKAECRDAAETKPSPRGEGAERSEADEVERGGQSRPIYAKIPGEKSRFYLTARMRCGNMITPLLRGLFFVPTSRARPATPREAK